MRKWSLWVAAVAALLCAATAVSILLLTKEDQPVPLSLPPRMCWGLVEGETLQSLMGPGREVRRGPAQNSALNEDHGRTHCEYEAIVDEGVDRTLMLTVNWDDPDEEKPLAGTVLDGDKPKTLHGNKNVYYLGSEPRLFIRCAPQKPGIANWDGRPAYLRIAMSIDPMDNSGASAREARKAGLKTLLHVGHEMEKRAQCSGDQSQEPKLTKGFATNWPGF